MFDLGGMLPRCEVAIDATSRPVFGRFENGHHRTALCFAPNFDTLRGHC
jgi:hypothetical protein